LQRLLKWIKGKGRKGQNDFSNPSGIATLLVGLLLVVVPLVRTTFPTRQGLQRPLSPSGATLAAVRTTFPTRQGLQHNLFSLLYGVDMSQNDFSNPSGIAT